MRELAEQGHPRDRRGLDMDFQGRPFGPMPQLMAMAEFVTKVHAICMRCGELASFSHRKHHSTGADPLGETDSYEPLCRSCFDKARSGQEAENTARAERRLMERPGHRLRDIARAIGGDVVAGDGEAWIEHLAVDTRKPLPSADTLFIALTGPRHDGHAYLGAMRDRGVGSFLVGPSAKIEGLPNVIRAKDTWDALHRLAAWHRGPLLPAGDRHHRSNGKDDRERMALPVVAGKGTHRAQPGQLELATGRAAQRVGDRSGTQPRDLRSGHQQAGRDGKAGARSSGPTWASSPTSARRTGRTSTARRKRPWKKRRSSAMCAHWCIAAIMRGTRGGRCAAVLKNATLCDWSRERSAFVHVIREQRTANGTRITVLHDHAERSFDIPFADAASVENTMHCITLLLHLGHDAEWIASRTVRLEPVAMRLQLVDGVNGSTLINDAYSNDLSSLAIALDHLNTVAHDRERIVVVSDILRAASRRRNCTAAWPCC
jgi:alanine racemase